MRGSLLNRHELWHDKLTILLAYFNFFHLCIAVLIVQASLFSNDLDRIKAIAGKWITCTAEIKAEFRQFSDRKWDGKSYYSRTCCLLAEVEELAKQK